MPTRNISDKLHQQMARLQEIAERKASQIDKSNYQKYNPLFQELAAYLKSQKCLLYGGMAINELLPARLKFYGDSVLPDIDVFAQDGKALANRVVAHFRSKGHDFTSASEALHPGTFKIYAEGLQVLDISSLDATSYKRLAKGAVKLSSGLKTADPQFLRMTLHILLSQPRDSHRWSKVLQRIVAFYDAFPVKAKCKNQERENTPDLSGARDWLVSHECVLCGTDALADVFKASGNDFAIARIKGVPPLAALVNSASNASAAATRATTTHLPLVTPEDAAKECIARLSSPSAYAIVSYIADGFLPAHVIVTHKPTREPVIGIYEAPACVSYVEYGKARVASIHTLLRLLLSHVFSSYKHARLAVAAYECLANMLTVVMLDTLTGNKKRLLQQFVVKCYGYQPGLVTMRRNRVKRKQAAKINVSIQ